MCVPAALHAELLMHHFRPESLIIAVVCVDDTSFGCLGLTEHIHLKY